MSEAFQIALLVIDVLEDLEIPYHVGGSFASSLHGIPRQTRDLDLVVELALARVPLLAARLQSDWTPTTCGAPSSGTATSTSSI
jgi:hypothetical protein